MAKIAIARAGHVGVTLAFACLIRGTGTTIALYDQLGTLEPASHASISGG